jgi:hypothetical protein
MSKLVVVKREPQVGMTGVRDPSNTEPVSWRPEGCALTIK